MNGVDERKLDAWGGGAAAVPAPEAPAAFLEGARRVRRRRTIARAGGVAAVVTLAAVATTTFLPRGPAAPIEIVPIEVVRERPSEGRHQLRGMSFGALAAANADSDDGLILPRASVVSWAARTPALER